MTVRYEISFEQIVEVPIRYIVFYFNVAQEEILLL